MILRREPEMAAVIGEPVSANPVVPSKRYWDGVRELCEQYGALLIFDEIIEGFGRTGKMFASEHYLTPDILVLGKSLGGGIAPLAGIVTREKYNVCQDRSVGHYTHEKNALSAAAALAEIEVIEKNRLCDQAAHLGAYMLERLREMSEKHSLIGSVMGIGLHIGIDLVRDRKTKERAIREAEMIMFKCLEKGLAFKTIDGNMITLRPALVVTREELDWALDILDESIGEVERGLFF
jgi:4-aminobutyrate aminotransferase